MSISENRIVGSGEFIYECHHHWDREGLPDGYEYGNASHGIAFDSQGLIYISHNGNPRSVDRANQRLQWFDMNGEHLQSLDGFLFPADIDVQGEFMLVPDLHARLTILNGRNEVVAQLGDDETWRQAVLADNFAMRDQPEQWRSGCFVHPHDARFDSDGNIYVAEWVRTGRITKLVRRT